MGILLPVCCSGLGLVQLGAVGSRCVFHVSLCRGEGDVEVLGRGQNFLKEGKTRLEHGGEAEGAEGGWLGCGGELIPPSPAPHLCSVGSSWEPCC